MSAVAEFEEFLRAFKNAEGVSDALLKAITVKTGLEDELRKAIRTGRTVIVTGSAGAGKTHLLRSLRDKKMRGVEVHTKPGAWSKPHVLLVEDATPLTPKERVELLAKMPKQRRATIVAINEGPLREAARQPGGDAYMFAVGALHQSQRGFEPGYVEAMPLVVNMAGLDPLRTEVISEVLGLPILEDVVHRTPCYCDPEDCPRRRAWRQLKSSDARDRIAKTASLATLLEPEWLFRDVWDFAADLALGGDCSGDPPTSPWFWRLFYGRSRIAQHLRDVADPLSVAAPGAESRLFYGDWISDALSLVDDLEFVPISQPDTLEERFAYVKAQYVVLGSDFRLLDQVLGGGRERIMSAVHGGETGTVIKGINDYMSYGLRDAPATFLELWADHSVERRTRKIAGILRVGKADAEEFAIKRDLAVINAGSASPAFQGTRRFLVRESTGASLAMDRGRTRLLQRGRSIRRSNREGADLDWDLANFFSAVLKERSDPHEFAVLRCHFERGRAYESRYRVQSRPPAIEEAL